jgi:hypothetical protein
MRRRTLLTSLILTAGCGAADSISPPPGVDADESVDAAEADVAQVPDAASAGDAGVACARAALGEISGESVMGQAGTEGSSATRADVRWVLGSSEGCIDRYYPTGSVSFLWVEACDSRVTPSSVEVQPGDGVLTIDRTDDPITYELRGATTWDATITCEGDEPESPLPVGGPWALARGSFDGDVLSGGFFERNGAKNWWDFTRAGAFPDDDAPDCAEPAVDHLWGTGFVSGGAEASLTWTRESSAGCTDIFRPSGVARAPTVDATCSKASTQPPAAPIASSDGELVVDRHRRPIRVELRGDTSWEGARSCTQPDGTMFIEHGVMGGAWAWFVSAHLDGTAFSGSTTFDGVDHAWSLTRLPPAAAGER